MKPQTILDSLSKDYRPLARAALDVGFRLTISHRGHPKLTAPDGRSIPLPTSSTSSNLHKGIRSKLRKMGVDV